MIHYGRIATTESVTACDILLWQMSAKCSLDLVLVTCPKCLSVLASKLHAAQSSAEGDPQFDEGDQE